MERFRRTKAMCSEPSEHPVEDLVATIVLVLRFVFGIPGRFNDERAGCSWAVAMKEAGQLGLQRKFSLGPMRLPREIGCRLDPKYVSLPVKRNPFQQINLAPPQPEEES
jgi:hypothetical protein